ARGAPVRRRAACAGSARPACVCLSSFARVRPSRGEGQSAAGCRRAVKAAKIPLARLISECLSFCMTETEIFKALADPTRRAVFERLAAGEMNATALRDGLPISQPALSQHIA